MDVLSSTAILGLGVLVAIQAYLSHLRAKEQAEALLQIRISINELTSWLAQNQGCMVPRGGGGQGEEPGKK